MSGSSELSRLLAAERAASPPPGSSTAGLERLVDSMTAGVAPLPVAAGSLQLGVSLVAKWVGVGMMIGVAGAGVTSLAAPVASRPATPVEVVRSATAQPAVAAVSTAAASLSAEPVPVDEPIPQLVASATRAVAAPSAPASASASPPANLDEELRLIAGAKRELDAGRAHLALAWLSEHRQRFPKGMLALEREGLQALAGCASGPRPELGRAFARHYPRSPMLGQVLRSCGLSEAGVVPSAATFSESANANGRLGEPTKR